MVFVLDPRHSQLITPLVFADLYKSSLFSFSDEIFVMTERRRINVPLFVQPLHASVNDRGRYWQLMRKTFSANVPESFIEHLNALGLAVAFMLFHIPPISVAVVSTAIARKLSRRSFTGFLSIRLADLLRRIDPLSRVCHTAIVSVDLVCLRCEVSQGISYTQGIIRLLGCCGGGLVSSIPRRNSIHLRERWLRRVM